MLNEHIQESNATNSNTRHFDGCAFGDHYLQGAKRNAPWKVQEEVTINRSSTMGGDYKSSKGVNAPLELLIVVGRCIVLVCSYLLGRRKRRKWNGDKW